MRPIAIARMKQAGGGGGSTPSFWSATNKGTNVVLSNGNADATNASGWQTVLGTAGKSSGKWAVEIVCVTTGGNHMGGIADLANLVTKLATYSGNSAEGCGYAVNNLYFNMTSSASKTGSFIAWGAGDTLTIALDISALTAIFYVNGVQSQTLSGLPSGKTWYPSASMESGGKQRIRTTSLLYPVATYSEWAS